MRFLRKMFSGKLGRALMPIVSIILFLWLVQSSVGPDTDISDVVQEIFNTVSSSASMTETEPDRNNFETSNTGTSQTNNSESVGNSIHAIKTNPSDFISVSDIPAMRMLRSMIMYLTSPMKIILPNLSSITQTSILLVAAGLPMPLSVRKPCRPRGEKVSVK